MNKFVWTVGFCGLGMGSVIGALIDLLVVGKATGMKAIAGTTVISTVVLASCNILCWRLDHYFHYFGGQENPHLFLGNGFVWAVSGGFLIGWLLFTQKGLKLLHRAGA